MEWEGHSGLGFSALPIVVDPKLAAGRGVEFSAAFQVQQKTSAAHCILRIVEDSFAMQRSPMQTRRASYVLWLCILDAPACPCPCSCFCSGGPGAAGARWRLGGFP